MNIGSPPPMCLRVPSFSRYASAEGSGGTRTRLLHISPVSPRTVSCCTKWAAGDRDPYPEWRFEYDHIFHSSDLALAPGSNAPAFLPYDYPGVAAPGCGDAFCTGENPPGNVTARSQGSWHRAVHATFERSA